MKKKILLAAGVILTLAVLIGTTYSYYLDTDSLVNEATSGKSDITIEEDFIKPPTDPTPGTTIKKNVSAIANGSDSYIRMMVLVNDSEVANCITLNYSKSQNWVKENDGYWYYKIPVKEGQQTDNLLESVTFNRVLPAGKNLEIICFGESVQSEGFEIGTKPYLKAFDAIK